MVSVRPELPINPPSKLSGVIPGSNDVTPYVLIDFWNHVAHRRDDDLEVLLDLADLRERGYVPRGLASYGWRREGRVTFLVQGPARNCKDPDYYYTNEWRDVSVSTWAL